MLEQPKKEVTKTEMLTALARRRMRLSCSVDASTKASFYPNAVTVRNNPVHLKDTSHSQ